MMHGELPFILRMSLKCHTLLELSTRDCKTCHRMQSTWAVVVGSIRTYVGSPYPCIVVDDGGDPYSLDAGASFRWEPVGT